MSIPYAKIEELINICKKVDEKTYEDGWDKRIHVRDIGATLQKLIDDDIAELDEMAKQFATQELLSPTAEEMEEINMISAEYDKARLEISPENT